MNRNTGFRLVGRWVGGACVVVSAVVLPWLWAGHSEIRRVTQAWHEGRVREFMRNWENLDLRMRDATTAGNVVLRFEGFNPDIPGHVGNVQQAAWRGAYAVYPRRVLVADEGTVINSARDILAAGFDPSVQWMQEHDVRTVIHFRAVGEDGFVPRLEVVPSAGGR